ncbi:MAG: hypothetical protein NT051_06935 [Candidatus Micrarchaeota archaeon]|nr:hypothetical protein [Candidatus Micrarchaeota archaeon]
MAFLRGQGTIESLLKATARPLRGQGATEYLVLLAVVLIVALVSIALLGFFPGLSEDAKIVQSQTYWKSASPIAIIETGSAYAKTGNPRVSFIEIQFRNNGQYPIRLTKIFSGDDAIASQYADHFFVGLTRHYFNDTIYIVPGQEDCLGGGFFTSISDFCGNRMIYYATTNSSGYHVGHSIMCNPDGTGTFEIKNLGFEYVEYIDGNEMTLQQVGSAPLLGKCAGVKTA